MYSMCQNEVIRGLTMCVSVIWLLLYKPFTLSSNTLSFFSLSPSGPHLLDHGIGTGHTVALV